jgi:hypothetical protein
MTDAEEMADAEEVATPGCSSASDASSVSDGPVAGTTADGGAGGSCRRNRRSGRRGHGGEVDLDEIGAHHSGPQRQVRGRRREPA